jgi:hypothetical protein
LVPLQPYARALTVPGDEEDAATLECCSDGEKVVGHRRPHTSFEVCHSGPRDLSSLGQIILRPSKQAAGGAALFGGNGHSDAPYTNC